MVKILKKRIIKTGFGSVLASIVVWFIYNLIMPIVFPQYVLGIAILWVSYAIEMCLTPVIGVTKTRLTYIIAAVFSLIAIGIGIYLKFTFNAWFSICGGITAAALGISGTLKGETSSKEE